MTLSVVADQIMLVRAAIDRIKLADSRRRECEADASSDSDDRFACREQFKAAEREFAWQWQNVEAILDQLQ